MKEWEEEYKWRSEGIKEGEGVRDETTKIEVGGGPWKGLDACGRLAKNERVMAGKGEECK